MPQEFQQILELLSVVRPGTYQMAPIEEVLFVTANWLSQTYKVSYGVYRISSGRPVQTDVVIENRFKREDV